MGPRKQRPRRTFRSRGLVVTEGTVTELEYFDRLKQELSNDGAFVQFKTVGVGKDPMQVVKKCIERRNYARRSGEGFDWCCCVVDVDLHARLDGCILEARREGIHLVISNLKFEIWLLWHVVDKRGALSSDQLDSLMREHGITDGKHLLPRFPVARFEDALQIARRADPLLANHRKGQNPSTSMPVLIELMRG